MARADSSGAKSGKAGTAEARWAVSRPRLAAVGLEAEFTLFLDGRPVRPEDVFADPRDFIRGPLMHRVGTSYHLPTAGVVYFDTGVIELATPLIELGRGCAARAGRSLWESLRFVRSELDAWERRTGHEARLVGFSAHYNISCALPRGSRGPHRTVEKLALLLSYILPVPIMLLATNRRSTGVGVRPRGERIEVTADFTPSAALMIATATLATGVVRDVMTWPSFELAELDGRPDIPIITGYAPVPHTSRRGWLANAHAYPSNPFLADPDAALWATKGGDNLGLREICARITRAFRRSIGRVSDPFTLRFIESVMRGRAPSLLDLDDRPPEYDDVGRLCAWDDLFAPEDLRRSRYERILIHAIAGRRLRIAGRTYTPVGMRGWSQVVFREDGEKGSRFFSIDYLLGHLDAWEESHAAPRRRSPCPAPAAPATRGRAARR